MDNRVLFLQWVLGDVEGFISVAGLHSRTDEFEEQIFSYPSDLEGVERYIQQKTITHNLYFCPTVLGEPRRVKKSVSRSLVLWADLDECDPNLLRVKPTIVLETSPGRWQAFWKLSALAHADDVEKINKRIAYAHADNGCDKTGWNLAKLLRIPGTKNHKYVPELYDVRISEFNRDLVYELSDFDVYPELGEERVEAAIPFPSSLPSETGEEILLSMKNSVHPRVWPIFEEVPKTDWSKALWQLMLMLFDAGAKPEEVFVVARDSACNKFERDRNSQTLLWRDVIRAFEHTRNVALQLSAADEEHNWYVADRNLLTEQERAQAEGTRTIINEYMDWATSIGDAAPAYHVAGAFVILSALISSSVRLPTSYGTVVPNLWFMILADTTLTRKTTAMDMAMDIVVEIDAEALAATDGSVEGLLKTISVRPRKPSIFLRDEVTGLLDAMKKKDYLAGMLETLTKLYDGKYQKKQLSKQTVELRDPILIMFVGGIKQRVYELLTYEHINSGFLPRFCVITAESDITRMRPLGPPTARAREQHTELIERFRSYHTFYNPPMTADQLVPQTWDVTLTPEAWMRYNKFEADMTEIGVQSAAPDLMTPVMARLCTSGLKAACLIAATRLEPQVTVTVNDLLVAFSYVETWKSHAINVVANAGKTAHEKKMERIYEAVVSAGDDGILRSRLMQLFRLDARESTNIFDTLLQRGLIRAEKGRGIRYYATRKTTIKEKIRS